MLEPRASETDFKRSVTRNVWGRQREQLLNSQEMTRQEIDEIREFIDRQNKREPVQGQFIAKVRKSNLSRSLGTNDDGILLAMVDREHVA